MTTTAEQHVELTPEAFAERLFMSTLGATEAGFEDVDVLPIEDFSFSGSTGCVRGLRPEIRSTGVRRQGVRSVGRIGYAGRSVAGVL